MRLLIYNHGSTLNIVPLSFSMLNLSLLYLCGGAKCVPRHDVIVSCLGLAMLLVWRPSRGPLLALTSDHFHLLFAMLSSLEVLFTLVLPWCLILWSHTSNDIAAWNYLLAPHLFVFQSQIALEGLVMSSENARFMFWYTVIANTYRATALATWVQRTIMALDKDEIDSAISVLTFLPGTAVLLWLCSNIFIVCVWYPVLPREQSTCSKNIDRKVT
ncbi:hypothetical protein IV203_023906 [Nitzschia inconspicua]|uniref:DUF7733 domain-containing protein n=1 Tax=Nitzschia inconspicua TaxID=303405 RepID=A0A9K3PAC6_9STRA|nr:hypothetical protein IV203_023906 [Nitzschia inconspicua]